MQGNTKENIKQPYFCTGCPLWGDTPVTDGFPAQRSSNIESVSISWRHHDGFFHYVFQDSGQKEKLVVYNVTEGDAGRYTCVANNNFGTVTASAWITVIPPRTIGE